MSPSDFGQVLKPFVFLDLFDNEGKPFSGFGLHPHSESQPLPILRRAASDMKTRTERRACCPPAVSNGCGPAVASGMGGGAGEKALGYEFSPGNRIGYEC